MLKKQILLCVTLSIFSHLTYADVTEQCPTVAEIKAGKFNAWLPEYIELEELASDADVALFAKNVEYLEVARWDVSYLETAHCFYHGSDPINNKIVFARDSWRPVSAGKWNWMVQDKKAECVSQNVSDCAFIM